MTLNFTTLLQVDKAKLKTIRVLFPLHREGLTSYLSPILGQYAIKNNEFINDFITKFNLFTKDCLKDQLNVPAAEAGGALYGDTLFVPLLVNIYKGGKFSITVKPPALGFLYSNMFKKRRRFYRSLLNRAGINKLQGLRNYKKLIQLCTFRFLQEPDFLSRDVLGGWKFTFAIHHYWMCRNALHQKK